jgi:hypothetical protein
VFLARGALDEQVLLATPDRTVHVDDVSRFHGLASKTPHIGLVAACERLSPDRPDRSVRLQRCNSCSLSVRSYRCKSWQIL